MFEIRKKRLNKGLMREQEVSYYFARHSFIILVYFHTKKKHELFTLCE